MTRLRGAFASLLVAAGILSAAAPPMELLNRITAEKYPDANAVVVFDSTLVTLNADGKSVTREHELVKIMTEQGKKEFSQTWSGYCKLTDVLELKLARTITPQGKVIAVDKKNITDVPMPLEEGGKFILPNVRLVSAQFPSIEIGSAVEWITEDRLYNPTMEGQFDNLSFFMAWEPIRCQSLVLSSPKTMNLRWLVKNGSLDTSFATQGDRRIMSWSKSDMPRLVYEPLMPFMDVGTKLLISTIPDWQTWSRWYSKLCAPQFEVDSALQAKITDLTRNLTDEDARIRALYNFVSTEIRYLETALSGKKAGYRPEKASLTYQKRYGVCRDKAALLVAMLRAIKVDAYIVLTNPSGHVEKDLPVDQFNHAIAAIRRPDGSFYYLDPTAENSRDYLAPVEMDREVLVADDKGEDLAKTPLEPPEKNTTLTLVSDTLSPDGNLSGAIAVTPRGVGEFRWRSIFKSQSPDERKQILERIIKAFGPSAVLDTFSSTDFNDMNLPLDFQLHFTVKGFATPSGGELRFSLPKCGTGQLTGSGWSDAVSLPVRKYPLDFHTTALVHVVHKLVLPPGYRVKMLPDTLRVAYERFSVHSATTSAGNTITNEVTLRLEHPMVPLSEYANLRTLMSRGEEIERQQVVLVK